MKFYRGEEKITEQEIRDCLGEKGAEIVLSLAAEEGIFTPGDVVDIDAPIRYDRRGLHHTGVDIGHWGLFSESGLIDDSAELLG